MRHDVRKGLWSFAIIASLGLAHVAGWAAIPTKIAHQGRLLDSADQPITSAVSVTFALYAVDTGGSALWSESQTIDPDDQGFYETFLGETTTLPSNLSDPLYLQMTVGIEILTPRLQVGSVPFALRAGDLECADCVASTEIAPETIVDADISASAAIAGTKTSPNFGSQNILTLGNVGIGTTTPGAKLTVNGPMIRQLARVQGYSSDDTDDGVLSGRLLSFIKTQNDTGIRVSWSDNFRVRGSDKACRWEIKFNGSPCANPGPLIFDKYQFDGNPSANFHDPGSFIGTCVGLTAGTYTIQGYVNSTFYSSGSDCYTGWAGSVGQLFSLEAEEVY